METARRPVILTIRRPHMKTVTDVFITNLAVADYLVYLVNVPMVTTLGNWGIGRLVKFMSSSYRPLAGCVAVRAFQIGCLIPAAQHPTSSRVYVCCIDLDFVYDFLLPVVVIFPYNPGF